jgi:3-deoxy-7-phosphoheptulonate synthase
MNRGLRIARQLLLDINALGMPCATEFLDTISPQYTADLVAWGAIGARTTESQVHREMASGLPCPVGFKNSTSGDMKVALDAVMAAKSSHCYLGVTEDGSTAVITSEGNPDGHVILRGGNSGPNYDKSSIAGCQEQITRAGVDVRMIVDCSHANSGKKHENQPIVARDVGKQVAEGNQNLVGVMIESNLVAGSQKVVPGNPLVYGQSITDACVDWSTTVGILNQLARDVRSRRQA